MAGTSGMTSGATDAPGDTPDDGHTPRTADELRDTTRRPNRTLAFVLLGIGLVFLGGAFGVGLLEFYGPY